MSRFRRLRLRIGRIPVPAPPAPGVNPDIWPGVDWTGAEGSGWSGGAVEPTASTYAGISGPMPTMMPMQPDYTVFAADGWIGFCALMNPRFSAVASVTVNCEGRETVVSEMTFRTAANVRTGETQSTWAYWFKVDVGSFSGYGTFRLYATATPESDTYDALTMGPFVYHHLAAAFDAEWTVNSDNAITSTNFATPTAAIAAAIAAGTYPRITITKAGTYDIGASFGTAARTPQKRWRHVKAADGVDVEFAATSFAASNYRNRLNNVWFERVRFDFSNIDGLYCEDQARWNIVFQGADLMRSVGRYFLRNQTIPGALFRYPASADSTFQGWFLDTYIHDMKEGPKYGWGVHVKLENTAGDCVTAFKSFYDLEQISNDPEPFRTGIDALRIENTSGSAITLAKTGGNEAADGTLVLTVGGTPYTINLTNTVGAATYLPFGVAAAINALGLSGVLAVSLSDERRASALTRTGTPGFGAFSAVTINSGTSLTLQTIFDVHGDLFQYTGSASPRWNVLLANIKSTATRSTQLKYLSSGGHKNFVAVNMLADSDPDEAYKSQLISSAKDNIWFAHCALPDQALYFELAHTHVDIHASVYKSIGTGAAMVDPAGDSNFVITGTPPAWADATTSTLAALFTDYAGGDYTPKAAGPLITAAVARTVPFDITGAARASTTAVGPYEAA